MRMQARTTRTVQAGAVALSVTESGQGPPLLLVHGFPLSHQMWVGQLISLAAHARVIAPDLRGCGTSQVTPGVVTMEQMADDLAALLDALDVTEPIVYCGLSMGGYVGFQFWRKYAARLRALVLCDTRAVADNPDEVATRKKVAEDVRRDGMQLGPAMEMLPRAFAPHSLENRPSVVQGVLRTILASQPEGVAAASLGMSQRPDVRDYLPRIAVPTLVIVGEHDAISPANEMRGIAEAIPGAEFVVIPGAGHMTPVESPAEFNLALERFLARV
jgi:pimeloyl-ACP methyl ester carboxylesterase